jgi:3-methyladenine DNA glycosylase/8-oxoguanine DNA glycosylase
VLIACLHSGITVYHTTGIVNAEAYGAADTIKQRVSHIVTAPFYPEGFLKTPPERLHSVGLSRAKVRYIRKLAGARS